MKSVALQIRDFFKSAAGVIAILIFLGLTIWRITLLGGQHDADYNLQVVWGASYQIMALWGAICGLFFSRLWGGWKSVVGRVNLAFALGLCAQLFGQSVSSYYFYHGMGVPYPSIGDIGFFGSIPFYIYGAVLLIRVSGGRLSLRSYKGRIGAIAFPVLMLFVSAFFFLKDYQFDWSNPMIVYLDFGYPLGQAIYVSIAALAFILSRNILGGMMRTPIILFIVALVSQYISDFTFLYQTHAGSYVAGGIDDYLYLVSYFLMGIALIQLGITFKKIRNTT